ncbi:MAG: RagB/SusD family nutrient uptake outer membrane protein [Adhaeribacter sp.]
MKKIFYILPFLIILGSCDNFLEVQPELQIDESQAIINAGTAESALNGLYNQLGSNGYYGSNLPALAYLAGGDIQWTGSQSGPQEIVLHNIIADNGYVTNAWSSIYKTILAANYLIVGVPNITDPLLTQAKREQFVGEASFVRALAYFDLARGWGGVPLILTPTRTPSDHANISRSSLNDTYAQVLKDLETAENLLPETTNRNRATKKTVWALRARYHLYRQEWAQAEQYASKIINDSNYKLAKPFNTFFANNAAGTPESVLELAYSNSFKNGHSNWWLPPALGGRREWSPSPALVELLNDPLTGGNRKELLARTAPPGNLWYGKLYYRTPTGTDPAYLIRVAELYLLRAEAQAQLGQLDLALIDLNAVRDRAGLAPVTLENKEDILLAIENERRLEFAFETDRWFNLVRTNRVAPVLGITDANKYLFPIPNAEIITNKNIAQNPGY